MIKFLLIAGLLGLAGVMFYVRLAPSDPAEWHVDPRAIPKPDKPNHWLIRPVGGDARPENYARDARGLAEDFDAVARESPRTELVAGSVAAGHMTYLTRSPWMGFPDYTSIRVYSTETGASYAAFARSRFGGNDWGTNRERLEDWVSRVRMRLER